MSEAIGVTPASRRVIAFDDRGLLFAARAREMTTMPLVILTPIAGMNRGDKSPMNLAGCSRGGQWTLDWALSVDVRRLQLGPSDSGTEWAFRECWLEIDRAVRAADSVAAIWEPPGPLAQQEIGTYSNERQKKRPWLELARLPSGSTLLVPLTTGDRAYVLSRLRCWIPGSAISGIPTINFVRQKDQVADLAHFVVLNPREEPGWRPAGRLGRDQAREVQAAFMKFPQRGSDQQVAVMERPTWHQ